VETIIKDPPRKDDLYIRDTLFEEGVRKRE
jgi:hypothetical protein